MPHHTTTVSLARVSYSLTPIPYSPLLLVIGGLVDVALEDLLAQLVWWSPLSAALTAVVGLAVIVASRPPATGRRR